MGSLKAHPRHAEPRIPGLWRPFWAAGVILFCGLALRSEAGLAGIRPNAGGEFLRTLVYVELALPWLLLPTPSPGRRSAIRLGGTALACFLASSAAGLIFSFAAAPSPLWDARLPAGVAWLASAGILSGAARRFQPGFGRGALLLVVGAPALLHYLALEYAGRSLLHLRGFSPHWVWAAGTGARFAVWPLAALGLAGFAVSLLAPGSRRRETD